MVCKMTANGDGVERLEASDLSLSLSPAATLDKRYHNTRRNEPRRNYKSTFHGHGLNEESKESCLQVYMLCAANRHRQLANLGESMVPAWSMVHTLLSAIFFLWGNIIKERSRGGYPKRYLSVWGTTCPWYCMPCKYLRVREISRNRQ